MVSLVLIYAHATIQFRNGTRCFFNSYSARSKRRNRPESRCCGVVDERVYRQGSRRPPRRASTGRRSAQADGPTPQRNQRHWFVSYPSGVPGGTPGVTHDKLLSRSPCHLHPGSRFCWLHVGPLRADRPVQMGLWPGPYRPKACRASRACSSRIAFARSGAGGWPRPPGCSPFNSRSRTLILW